MTIRDAVDPDGVASRRPRKVLRSLPRSVPGDRESGQAYLEFLIASLMALVMILGVIQMALMFNAHSMLKLAAFNAARAAIVARGENPTDPVTRREMRRAAKMAAYVTLFPVFGQLHGRDELHSFVDANDYEKVGELMKFEPESTQPYLSLPESLENRRRWAALEYFFIRVDFVLPRAQDPTSPLAKLWPFAAGGQPIEFDNRRHASLNVVKVLVTWQYPLVIPFVNRIFVAIARPEEYVEALTERSEDPDDPNYFETVEDAVRSGQIPIWAVGTAFGEVFFSRIPMRATAIMRMQWDRGPGQ